MREQQLHHQAGTAEADTSIVGDMPEAGQPDSGELADQRYKTIGVRIDEGLHAQLRFIAQLSDSTITDEIRRAIEQRIVSAQDDPELIARAQAVREEIEREAAARSAAIAGFIGSTATHATAAAVRTAPAAGTVEPVSGGITPDRRGARRQPDARAGDS